MNNTIKLKIKLLAGYLLVVIAVVFVPNLAKAASYNVGYQVTSFQATTPLETKTYDTHFWYPTNDTPSSYSYGGTTSSVALNGSMAAGQHPTVVFSHGDLGCATQSVFITESLAKAGYIVAAITYRDANTNCGGSGNQTDQPPISQPSTWTSDAYLYRKYDTSALIDKLISMNSDSSSFLYGSVRVDNMGFVGHSLGGYTGIGLVGGWSSWLDSRIHAALLLSPFSQPYTLNSTTIPNIQTPIMLQGGTLDLAITPNLQSFYNLLTHQKYFLVLKSAGHFAWTNTTCNNYTSTSSCLAGSSMASAIVTYGQSFLDTYIAQTSASVNTKMSGALKSYVYNTSVPLAKTKPTSPVPNVAIQNTQVADVSVAMVIREIPAVIANGIVQIPKFIFDGVANIIRSLLPR